MTKDEYMQALKNNIQALTIDEQKEALQYYYDYFEDAGFDEEKVLQDLGTPEQVAQTIIQNFANTLVASGKNEETSDSEEENGETQTTNSSDDALYYEFDKKLVKNISFSFGAAEVVAISGKKFAVETRGIQKDNLLCRIDSNDTLVVKNLNKLQNFNIFGHERKTRFVPRILLTIPQGAKVELLKISVGAGKFETKELDFTCEKGSLETGAGNFVLNGLKGKNVNVRCGMGNVHFIGALEGKINIDCGMGAVKLELTGNPSDCSYDAKVGLGDVKFNGDKKSGLLQYYANDKKMNHYSVNCGMGSVNISIKE